MPNRSASHTSRIICNPFRSFHISKISLHCKMLRKCLCQSNSKIIIIICPSSVLTSLPVFIINTYSFVSKRAFTRHKHNSVKSICTIKSRRRTRQKLYTSNINIRNPNQIPQNEVQCRR
ncbi:hypothetical protein D3C87_1088440 [compost metagenome]